MFDFLNKFFSEQKSANPSDNASELRLFNTLTKKKELFEPLSKEQVTVYSCGPTVYKKQHIGNMRAFVFADTLHRALKGFGYNIRHVINITDVGHLTDDADQGEDKLEKSAKQEGKKAKDIADEITALFLKDLLSLNINTKEYSFPRATEHIQAQIEMILSLQEKGYTYKIKDGVYFDTSKFGKYGELGNINKEGLQEGVRVSKTHGKRNPTDFALWKFSDPEQKRQQEWDSPWGKGFPGWHIECSAMSKELLGPQIDIHTGGVEHIAIHHNNEIAQSECSNGLEPFVRYWLHGQHLKINGEKMSKSLGNVLYLSDLQEKGYDSSVFRYLLLTAHYRSEINFTFDALDAARVALFKLRHFTIKQTKTADVDQEYLDRFQKNIADDLNTARALAVLWEMMKSSLPDAVKYATLLQMNEFLGLDLKGEISDGEGISIPQEVKDLADQRQKARMAKQWDVADNLRRQIQLAGFDIVDTKDGYSIHKL